MLLYFLKDNANFVGISVKEIDLKNRTENIKEARAKYDSYDPNKWEKSCFDNNTGGYLITEKARIEQSQKSDNETKKFDKEQKMCKVLVNNGYAVEHLDDNHGASYDIHLNGIKADLKKTAGSGNIEKYAKKAIRKQGANLVVFEFEHNMKDIHTKLLKLRKNYDIHGYYYFSNNKIKIYGF